MYFKCGSLVSPVALAPPRLSTWPVTRLRCVFYLLMLIGMKEMPLYISVGFLNISVGWNAGAHWR